MTELDYTLETTNGYRLTRNQQQNLSQKAWVERQKAAQGEWSLLEIMLSNFSRE